MDNTNPNQQQNPQNPPQYQPFGQQPPAGGNQYLARVNAFRRQRPVLAGVAALIAICVVCAACAGIVQGISGAGQTAGAQSNVGGQSTARINGPTATPKPTATATATPKPKVWTTVQTFTGNGIKKTGTFTVPDDWKLIWTCKPSSFFNGSYNLIVTVYNSDGSYADLAVNTICKSGNTSDTTEEHSGGQVYLDINSEAYWQLQVQELK